MQDLDWGVVVLAAGQGTRMRSAVPKVMHELAGRPLIDHVLDVALELTAAGSVVVVVGHGAGQVAAHVRARGVPTAIQEPQLGTGDALRVGMSAMPKPPPDAILVLSGDVPLLRVTTLRRLQRELAADVAAALLTAEVGDGSGYGRILRAADGTVRAVVEARDADAETLAVREVNAGIYALRTDLVAPAVTKLAPDNSQGEYYLTDLPAILRRRGGRVVAVRLDDADEMHGVNTRRDLATAAVILNRRTVDGLLAAGVSIEDPATTWIDPRCRIEADVVIEPGVVLRGECVLGAGARIGAHCVLTNVRVGAGEQVSPLTRRPG